MGQCNVIHFFLLRFFFFFLSFDLTFRHLKCNVFLINIGGNIILNEKNIYRLCNTSTYPSGVIVFLRKYDTFEKNLAKFFTNFFAFFS